MNAGFVSRSTEFVMLSRVAREFRFGTLLASCLGVLFCGISASVVYGQSSPVSPASFQSELVFPYDPKHNHAPGIAELANGDLIVSWYRGSGERSADDVAVLGARKPKGASAWSDPFLMVDTPGFPDCNTCLMTDAKGQLFLFWPVIIANSWESCITRFRVSTQPVGVGCPEWQRDSMMLLKPNDFGERAAKQLDEQISKVPAEQMSERRVKVVEAVKAKLGDKLYQRLGWQPRCKPTVLPNGRILLPLYSDTYSLSIMAISDDGGTHWFASEPLIGFGAIQPSVMRRNDGTLVAYMRENGYTGFVRSCESKDDGMTWGPVGITSIPNPGSGLDGVRLANGNWVLLCNDTKSGRNRLTLLLSEDEGATWPVQRSLEDHPEGSYHYPAIIQGKDGTIHAIYSYFVKEGKSMKHAAFNESWMRGRQ
jgi:predicted neuraminidase